MTPIAQPPALLRYVPLDFPAAIQAVAALDERIRLLQSLTTDGDGAAIVVASAAAAHRAVVAIREAFRFPEWTEAALDAAHEASVAEFAELADAEASDAPLADPGDHFVYPAGVGR